MADSNRGLWFLLGVSVGALAGVLYAPQSGEETRDLLSRKAEEGRDMVSRKTSDLREQAGAMRDTMREQASNLREQAGSLREQATDIAGRGKQAVTRQIDQFQAAVEAGKQAYRESAGLDKGADQADGRSDATASRL